MTEHGWASAARRRERDRVPTTSEVLGALAVFAIVLVVVVQAMDPCDSLLGIVQGLMGAPPRCEAP